MIVTSDLSILHDVFVKKFLHFHGRKLDPIAGDVDTNDDVAIFLARGQRWKRLRCLSISYLSSNPAQLKCTADTICFSPFYRIIVGPSFTSAHMKAMLPTLNNSCAEMKRLLLMGVEQNGSVECTK